MFKGRIKISVEGSVEVGVLHPRASPPRAAEEGLYLGSLRCTGRPPNSIITALTVPCSSLTKLTISEIFQI